MRGDRRRWSFWPAAEAAGVAKRREAMFSGEKINITENRAVLHGAPPAEGREGAGRRHDVVPDVHTVLDAMRNSLTRCAPAAKGATGKRSPTSSTSASAAPTSARSWRRWRWRRGMTGRARIRVQHRRRAYPRHAEGPVAGDDAFHHRVEDLHHGRDDDQRRDGQALDTSRSSARAPSPTISLRCRPRSTSSRNWHRKGPCLRLLGLGRRPLFAVGRHRPADHDCRGREKLPRFPRRRA